MPYRRTVIVSAILLITALLSCCFMQARNEDGVPSEYTQTHSIRGYCTDFGSEGSFGNSTVNVTSLDGKECDFRMTMLRVNAEAPTPYRYFTAKVVFEDEESNNAEWRGENIVCSAVASTLTESDEPVKGIAARFFSLGTRLQSILHENLSDESASLADALLLGRREGLSSALKRDFKTLGISHLLAVSGMHLSILTAALMFLLAKLRAGRILRAVICTLFILLYCGICGFGASILRAALMAICLMAANLASERISGIRCLLLSLTAILLVRPYLMFDVSLQLSATATLGILVLYPILSHTHTKRRKKGLTRVVLLPFALTLSATVFTLPVLYLRFGTFSLASALANLLFVPLITLLMYALPIFLLLSVFPSLDALAAPVVELLCDIVCRLCGLGRYCKDLYCHIPFTVLVLLLFCLMGTFVLYRYRVRYGGILACLAICSALVIAYPFSVYNDSRLLYRYNGQRESILLRNENHVIYIETGNSSRTNAYTALCQTSDNLLQTGIDTLVLTHYHASLPSFVKYMLENTYLDAVYLPRPQNDSEAEYASRVLSLCKAQTISCIYYEDNAPLSLYEYEVTVHNEHLKRSTHPAQAISVLAGQSRVLLCDPAVFELDGIGAIDLSNVDHLVLLQSPPVDKYPLPAMPNADGVHAVYADAEQYQTVGCPFSRYTVLDPEQPLLLIRFD